MAAREVTGQLLSTREPCVVRVGRGRIAAVSPAAGPVDRADLALLAPGLLDIQVNGFEGWDFNADRPVPEAVGEVRDRLRAGCVTAFCPTVVTGPPEAMRERLRAIATAVRADRSLARAVPCVHLEGPFISPEDGPRGAHPADHVIPASRDAFATLQAAADGLIGIVTLAPEVPGALDLTRRLAADGLVVAIGHTGASRSVIREAVMAGARLSTHLGNGAHAMLPRHDNYLWEQLAADDLFASIIVDGHHLPPPVVKSIVRAKGPERVILASDAVHLAGLQPGRYTFSGLDVDLLPSGRVNLAGTPYLAGSALSLLDGVWNTARFAGIPLSQAWTMASTAPWRLLGRERDRGRISVGCAADLVRLSLSGDGRPMPAGDQ